MDSPTFVEGFLIRADLDSFTSRVNAAFAANDINAIKKLVLQFLQLMKLPDAFEEFLDRPLIRLPWAGDCYNAVLLPKDYEDYAAICDYLPAVASLRWHNPDGSVMQCAIKLYGWLQPQISGRLASQAGKRLGVFSSRMSKRGSAAFSSSPAGVLADHWTRRMRGV